MAISGIRIDPEFPGRHSSDVEGAAVDLHDLGALRASS